MDVQTAQAMTPPADLREEIPQDVPSRRSRLKRSLEKLLRLFEYMQHPW